MTEPTDIITRKLRAAISDCSPTGYCTLRVSTIDRAIATILSQQAIIEKLQETNTEQSKEAQNDN